MHRSCDNFALIQTVGEECVQFVHPKPLLFPCAFMITTLVYQSKLEIRKTRVSRLVKMTMKFHLRNSFLLLGVSSIARLVSIESRPKLTSGTADIFDITHFTGEKIYNISGIAIHTKVPNVVSLDLVTHFTKHSITTPTSPFDRTFSIPDWWNFGSNQKVSEALTLSKTYSRMSLNTLLCSSLHAKI